MEAAGDSAPRPLGPNNPGGTAKCDSFVPPKAPENPRRVKKGDATYDFWLAVKAVGEKNKWILDKTAAELNAMGKVITMSSLAGSLYFVEDDAGGREKMTLIHRGVLHVPDSTLPTFFRLVAEHPDAVLYLSVFCTPKHPIYIDVDLASECSPMDVGIALNVIRRSGILLPGLVFDDGKTAQWLHLPQLKRQLLACITSTTVNDLRASAQKRRAEAAAQAAEAARQMAEAKAAAARERRVAEAEAEVAAAKERVAAAEKAAADEANAGAGAGMPPAAKRAKAAAAGAAASELYNAKTFLRRALARAKAAAGGGEDAGSWLDATDPTDEELEAAAASAFGSATAAALSPAVLQEEVTWLDIVRAFLGNDTHGAARFEPDDLAAEEAAQAAKANAAAAAAAAAGKAMSLTMHGKGEAVGGDNDDDDDGSTAHSRRSSRASSCSAPPPALDLPEPLLLAVRRLLMLALANVLQRAVRRVFPDASPERGLLDQDLTVYVLGNYGRVSEIKRRQVPPPMGADGAKPTMEQYCATNWGGHLYMRGVTVDREVHMAVYEVMCQLLGNMRYVVALPGFKMALQRQAALRQVERKEGAACLEPDTDMVTFHKYWRNAMDAAPFLGDTGALRPPFSCKARPCPRKTCARSDGERAACNMCHGRGVLHIDRMYAPVGMVQFAGGIAGVSVMAADRNVDSFFGKRYTALLMCNPRTLQPQTPGECLTGIDVQPTWGLRYKDKVEQTLARHEPNAATRRHLERMHKITPDDKRFAMFQTVIDDADHSDGDLSGTIWLPVEDPRFKAISAWLPNFCAENFHGCYRNMTVRGVSIVYEAGEPVLARVTVRGPGSARCYNRRTDVDASENVRRDLEEHRRHAAAAAQGDTGAAAHRQLAMLVVPGEHNNWTACVSFVLRIQRYNMNETADVVYHLLTVQQMCKNTTLHTHRRRQAFTDRPGATCKHVGAIEERVFRAERTAEGLKEARNQVRCMFYTPAEINRSMDVHRARILGVYKILVKHFRSKVPVVGPYDAYTSDVGCAVSRAGMQKLRAAQKNMTPEQKTALADMRTYYGIAGDHLYDRYKAIYEGEGEGRPGGDVAAARAAETQLLRLGGIPF